MAMAPRLLFNRIVFLPNRSKKEVQEYFGGSRISLPAVSSTVDSSAISLLPFCGSQMMWIPEANKQRAEL